MSAYNLTANEEKAALALYNECLACMGGENAADLQNDPMTEVDAATLIACGWSRHEAAGTFGALIEKGVIFSDDDESWLSDDFIEELRKAGK